MKFASVARAAVLLSLGMAQANVEVSIASIVDDMNSTSAESSTETVSTEAVATEDEPVATTEATDEPAVTTETEVSSAGGSFNRISTWFVCTQLDPDCNVDDETSAETIWVTKDHNTLVYTDSPGERVGFVDISDASSPKAAGYVELPGEPTTVRIHGDYAVVGVNTSPDFVNPSGVLAVIDIESKSIVHEIDIMGQPDAVDVSKDEQYIAIAIENERDEDLGDGVPPQMPAGFVVIIDTPTGSAPEDWTVRQVNMTGLDILYPEDPEPEYVSINKDNIAVVTLQENNGIALIDLASGEVTASFNAGEVSVDQIDLVEDSVIMQTESATLLREPDGVSWIGTEYYTTANEGDMDGGSRGFTIFNAADNSVAYDSGNEMEMWTARLGHYPEERSENKGNEPENVLYSEFNDGSKYLFVLSERSSLVFVYNVADPTAPELLQILPCTTGPEGVVAIPERNLLAVASEVDERDNKIRSSVAIYELSDMEPIYPTIISDAREDGTFIPFAALSGLSASSDENVLYTIEDSFFKQNRVLAIDTSSYPAVITNEMRITDPDGAMKACIEAAGADATEMVNEDMTVNIDPEGISADDDGFWVVSEGAGTVGDESKPFESPNMLLRLDSEAAIEECILLPGDFPSQVRYGFEGVAQDGDHVVIAIQRPWGDEEYPRLAVYNTATEMWKYAFYPLDDVESQYGGWVGLSDITNVGEGEFLVLERDNQGGPDAAVKRIYHVDMGTYIFSDGSKLNKELVKDLMEDLESGNGSVIEKVEGMAVTPAGDIWINSDNDGVDDNSGEQALMKVGEYEMEQHGSSASSLTIGVSFLAATLLMALF